MARVVAPPSVEHQENVIARTNRERATAIRGKAVMTQTDRDEVIRMLLDDYLARHPVGD